MTLLAFALPFATMLFAPAASAVPAVEALKVTWTYDPELMPDNLVLDLRNVSDAAQCVSAIALDEGLDLSQRGASVFPRDTPNRAMLIWKDADLIAGMKIIPPGKSIETFYLLSRWPLAAGPASASVNLPVYDCATFFTATNPQPERIAARFTFER